MLRCSSDCCRGLSISFSGAPCLAGVAALAAYGKATSSLVTCLTGCRSDCQKQCSRLPCHLLVGAQHVSRVRRQMPVLQCLLRMPQFEFALSTAESTAKVQNSGQNWGICSKHCSTTGHSCHQEHCGTFRANSGRRSTHFLGCKTVFVPGEGPSWLVPHHWIALSSAAAAVSDPLVAVSLSS